MAATLFPASLVDRIGWLLVHSVWQFALLGLVLAAVLQAVRRLTANVRYWICVVGWCLLLLAPAVTWPLLPMSLPEVEAVALQTAAVADAAPPQVAMPMEEESPALASSTFPSADLEATAVESAGQQCSSTSATPWWEPLETAIAPWLKPLVSLWSLGVLLFALRPGWGWYVAQRLKRCGISAVPSTVATSLQRVSQRLGMRREVHILQSALVRVPAVVGYLRPVVLLPLCVVNGLTAAEVEAILAHELAHIRRHDYLINLLQTLSETVFFYHPAVWWVSGRIRQEREHCCDDLAVHVLGSRVEYGRALLALEELRGTAPALSLGANTGSLLQRFRRLATPEPSPRMGAGGVASLAMTAMLLIGVGVWTATQAQETASNPNEDANAQQESVSDSISPDESVADEAKSTDFNNPAAKQLALRSHGKAAAIDKLPRFYIRAHGKTETDYEIKDPSDQSLDNLQRALDPVVAERDWYRYEDVFAWDQSHFLIGNPNAESAAPDRPDSWDTKGRPPFRFVRWGTRELSGQYSRGADQPARHVLRTDAAAIWKDLTVCCPNYLLATHHKFWWGYNSYHSQHFSNGSVPPQLSTYRSLGTEEFDGELCDVVLSPTRFNQLWISRRTGLIRGLANYYVTGPITRLNQEPAVSFYKSAAVKEAAGREFDSQRDYAVWYQNEFADLPIEKQWDVSLAWSEFATKDFEESTAPGLLVRFRDFREIAPGVWWPFREDRAQGHPQENCSKCMVSSYTVRTVRTDVDLTPIVQGLQPKDGERVQDQRFAVPVNYAYRRDRTEDEIRKLADAEYQKRLEDQEIVNRLKEPIEKMVGRPAPPLPQEGWIGGTRPDVSGKPYLIHFWAAWCGPCKNDFPILKQIAETDAPIVAMHPAGTPIEEVKKVMNEFGLEEPTFVSSKTQPSAAGKTIAGYPLDMFPYYIVVDAEEKVAAHGFLRENNMEVIAKFRTLLGASTSKGSETQKQTEAATETPPSNTEKKVEILCIDADGRPVAGAEVHLFQFSTDEKRQYLHFGPFKSDEQGRVTCERAIVRDDEGRFDRWIYARVPGRLVGATRSFAWKNGGSYNSVGRVQLQPSRSVEGVVTVPDGFDPTQVTVRTQALHIVTGRGDFDYESFDRSDSFPGLDTALPEFFEKRPDAEGRIRFDDVPVRGRLYLLTVAEGLGEAQWVNADKRFDEPIRLTVEKEGVVIGHVLLPDGKPAVGMQVAARLSPRGRRRNAYLSTFRSISGEEGAFSIHGLPTTEFNLSAKDPKDRVIFRPQEKCFIAAGQTRDVLIQMETGILVSGRVFDRAGKPVASASFSVLADSEKSPLLAHDSTDADGRYQFRLPAGGAQLYFDALPPAFIYPDPQIVKKLDVKAGQAAIEDLDFTLTRKSDGNN